MVWWPGWWNTGCGGDLGDPGPCPVDDTPHTACTPESVAAGKVIVPVHRPFVLDAMAPAPAPAERTVVEINPKTYRGLPGVRRPLRVKR